LAQEAGLTNINLDLLWALPGQGLDAWLKNLQSALCLGPRHLSCYALTPEPGTALYRDLGSQDLPAQPRQTVQAAMYAQGVRLIAQSGLRQYEIANFAAPGSYCRHNWGYWQGRPYLGLGPAAVSTLDHRRWENPHSLKSYARAISEQTLGQPAQALTRHEQLQETLMLRLRTTPGLDRLAFKQRFGLDPVSECKPLIAELQGQGLLEFDAQTLRLSDQGLILSDSILASLFAALAPRDHFCLGRSQTSPGSPNKQDRWPGLQDCQDQTNESE
jgi:oxygen-independent coproporphyrinogen-3 oxidase